MSTPPFERFLTPGEIAEVFGEAAVAQAMFDFEAALARAEAAEGVVPTAAAQAIAGMCKAELFDLPAMFEASTRAGSVAIPLVRELTKAVALFSEDAASWVHWGSTSQDVIDTAMALSTRRAAARLDASLLALATRLLDLADAHADTPVLARTLMQPAAVTSFGLKCADWAAPLVRARSRIALAASRALVLQLGGAVGTLGVLGERGPAVAQRMAELLGLGLPPAPWHTQRDDWVRLGMELAVCTGSLGKIAKDLALMAQGEVGELAEPSGAGRGGSTAMPHKRNPVSAMVALAAAQRAPHRAAAILAAMGQEHERGLGNWQAELAEWPGLCTGACASALALAEAFDGVTVNAERMRDHIEAQHGLVYAEAVATKLIPVKGRVGAQSLVEGLARRAVNERQSLPELLRQARRSDATLLEAFGEAELDALFDPLEAVKPAARLARERTATLRADLATPPSR